MAETSTTEQEALARAREAAQKLDKRSWFQKAWDNTLGNRSGLSPVTDVVSGAVSKYTGIESPTTKKAFPLLVAAAGGFGLFHLTQKFMQTKLGKMMGTVTSSIIAAVGGIVLNRWLQMPEGTGMKVVVEPPPRDALVVDEKVLVPKKDAAGVQQEPEPHIVTKAKLDAIKPPEIRWPDIKRMQVADLNAGHKFSITTSSARHQYQTWEEGMRALDGYFKPYRDDVPRIRDVLKTNGLTDRDVMRLIPPPPPTPKLFSKQGHPLGGVDDVSEQLHEHGARICGRCQHESWFIGHVKDSSWYKKTYEATGTDPLKDPNFGQKVWDNVTISTKLNLLNEYHERIQQTMLKEHEWPKMQLHVGDTTLSVASVTRTLLSPLELLGADNPASSLFSKSTLDSVDISETIARYARQKEAGTLSKYDHARMATIYEGASRGGYFDNNAATKHKCTMIAESLRCKVLQADLEHFDTDYHQNNRGALEAFATKRLPIYNKQVDTCKENIAMLKKHHVVEFIVAPEDKRKRALSQAWEAFDRLEKQWENMPSHAKGKAKFYRENLVPARAYAMKLARQPADSYRNTAERDDSLLEIKDCRDYTPGHSETAQGYYAYITKQSGKTMITALECIGDGACDLKAHPLETPIILGKDRGAAFTQAVDQFNKAAHERRLSDQQHAQENSSMVIVGKTRMPEQAASESGVKKIPEDILIAIDYSKADAPKRILLKGYLRTANGKTVFKINGVKKTALNQDAIYEDALNEKGWSSHSSLPNMPQKLTIGDRDAYKKISETLNGLSRMTRAVQDMDGSALSVMKDVLGVALAQTPAESEKLPIPDETGTPSPKGKPQGQNTKSIV